MILDTVSNFKRKIAGKVFAYNQVFDRKNQYTREVLIDLAKFCRAHETTFHADQRIHAVMEGRREVWLKIQEMLELTTEEIYDLHKIKEIHEQNLKESRNERKE